MGGIIDRLQRDDAAGSKHSGPFILCSPTALTDFHLGDEGYGLIQSERS